MTPSKDVTDQLEKLCDDDHGTVLSLRPLMELDAVDSKFGFGRSQAENNHVMLVAITFVWGNLGRYLV